MVPNRYLKYATAASLALVVLFSTYTYKKYRIAPAIALTELEALDAQGKKMRVWPNTGRAVIIVFYASWCHDCTRELPKLERALQGPLRGTDVIALTDEDAPTMARYRDQTKYSFRFYALPQDFENYGIHAIPTVYVLNAHGETVFTKVGDVDWSSVDFIRHVKRTAAPD